MTDAYLQSMKASRKSPAVLKLRLVNLRSQLPKAIVFAFEGDDDKIIYHNWVTRVRLDLSYEPFPCSGKRYVLELKKVVLRDRNNLIEGLYFFVDKDFDELAGHEPHDHLFMTDRYSVENYLVSTLVLDLLLKSEFHCHMDPALRGKICSAFEELYESFLDLTSEINFRLFVARKLQIAINPSVPRKISKAVGIRLSNVVQCGLSAEQFIVYQREPSLEEIAHLLTEFSDIDKSTGYRGKFALEFFTKWLEKVADELDSSEQHTFKRTDHCSKVRRSGAFHGNLASKSAIPSGLPEFLNAVTGPV